MERFRKFLRLRWRDRLLLAEAVAVQCAFRLGISALPFGTIWAVQRRPVRARAHGDDAAPTRRRIAWAVATTSALVPRSTCLTRALATRSMLRRRGIDVTLRLGVARGPDAGLLAHAWVEAQREIVIGMLPDGARFVPLPTGTTPLPAGAAATGPLPRSAARGS